MNPASAKTAVKWFSSDVNIVTTGGSVPQGIVTVGWKTAQKTYLLKLVVIDEIFPKSKEMLTKKFFK